MRATATYLDNESGLQASLVGDGQLDRPRAVALVLHGGKEDSLAPTEVRQLAVMRMTPIARHLVTTGAAAGLAVWRLRFRYRGWNKADAHPVHDLRWALRQMRVRHGNAPVVLVGHSMGGRAAIRLADDESVVGVLGLAPWIPPAEPREQLAGRRLLVVHGARDRITSCAASKDFVEGVRPIAKDAAFIGLRGCGHAMVRRVRVWNSLTAQFVLYAGLGVEPSGALATALREGSTQV